MEINIGDLVLENEIELGAVELDIKTEVPDIEDLTVIPTKQEQVFTHPNSYGYDEVTVEAIPQEYIIPEGTFNITENGEYNIKNYENANVNVSSEPSFTITNCEQLFSNNRRLESVNDLLPFCKPTNCNQMFAYSTSLTEIPVFDTSVCTNCSNMFDGCNNLTSIPQIILSFATSVFAMFNNCSKLVSVPELDFGSVTGTNMNSLFYNCSSLSDESLNNIMISVIKAPIYVSSRKKLSYIGLSSEQATRCQSLSNYQAFLNAGWTTGY